jgi:hypothetical protein
MSVNIGWRVFKEPTGGIATEIQRKWTKRASIRGSKNLNGRSRTDIKIDRLCVCVCVSFGGYYCLAPGLWSGQGDFYGIKEILEGYISDQLPC